jgi:hypothetical protein
MRTSKKLKQLKLSFTMRFPPRDPPEPTDLDDPLIVDPPRLIDWDWVPEQLTLILSRSVDGRWIHALRTMGNYSSVWGKGISKTGYPRQINAMKI